MAKLAYAAWPWGCDTREQYIEACKDLSSLGYRYFESVRTFIDLFKDDINDFKAISNEYGMKPISFYFHFTGVPKDDIKALEERIDFVAANDIKTICVQGLWVAKQFADEDLRETLHTINEYARICKGYDILPCVHPHANTTIMYESEIDFIMQNTDPKLVGFAPDTAHLQVGKCDPVAICERYKDRIAFTHIKDVLGELASSGMQNGVEVYTNFLELGTGEVNLDGVFDVLKKIDYSGYLCPELDKAPQSNIESAKRNKEYIEKHWGPWDA